jgi:hypothetical protein
MRLLWFNNLSFRFNKLTRVNSIYYRINVFKKEIILNIFLNYIFTSCLDYRFRFSNEPSFILSQFIFYILEKNSNILVFFYILKKNLQESNVAQAYNLVNI